MFRLIQGLPAVDRCTRVVVFATHLDSQSGTFNTPLRLGLLADGLFMMGEHVP